MESSDHETTSYFAIINKRKWSFFIPCIIALISSVAISFYLPSIYKSTARILVDRSVIPSTFVKQSVTSYAEVRYRYIKQEILTSKRLEDLIEQHGLYSELKEKLPIEEIIALVRSNINIESVSEEEYFSGESIAFVLSYEDLDPQVAQQITELLTAMFLQENINIRKKQSSETTQFLEKEASKLKKELDAIEDQISSFKKEHINELPSLLQLNIQRLQEIELRREGVQEKLLSINDIQHNLRVRLATIPKDNSALLDQKKLVDIETRLANLRSQYSEVYPDVMGLKAELAELREKIAANPGEGEAGQSYLYNPAHVALESQLSTVLTEINSLKRQLKELDIKQDEYQARIETTLRLEDDYTTLINKRNNTQAKHNDLIKKIMDAKVSYGLEEEQKGERFTLLHHANYPRKPYKPNRLAIILLGCFAGVGLGSGLVAIQEYNDHSIRDGDMLANLALGPVLGSVPVISAAGDNSRMRKGRLMILVLILAAVIGILLAVNNFSSSNIVESVDQVIEYFASFNVIESVNQVVGKIKEAL